MLERLSLMTFTMDIDVAMKKMTVRDCLALARDEGLSYVDVMNPSESRVQEYAAAAEETGVGVLCFIGTVSFFSCDEKQIEETFSRHLRYAAELGARLYMIVPMNAQRDGRVCAALGKAEVQKRLKRYFSLAVGMAEGTGIRVCFETTPWDYTCLSGAEDCRRILEQVPGLALVYDTANMLPHGDEPLEYYEALKPYIVHTHLKDVALTEATWRDRLFRAERAKSGKVMKCCVFGEGIIPLKEILRRMERDGYRGSYALEYSHPEKYPADMATNGKQLKRHIAFLK